MLLLISSYYKTASQTLIYIRQVYLFTAPNWNNHKAYQAQVRNKAFAPCPLISLEII